MPSVSCCGALNRSIQTRFESLSNIALDRRDFFSELGPCILDSLVLPVLQSRSTTATGDLIHECRTVAVPFQDRLVFDNRNAKIERRLMDQTVCFLHAINGFSAADADQTCG